MLSLRHPRPIPLCAVSWRRTDVRLSRTLEATLAFAVREARDRRHEYLCIEHVLFALLHDPQIAHVLVACGGDVERLKTELRTYLDERLEKLPDGRSEEHTSELQSLMRIS